MSEKYRDKGRYRLIRKEALLKYIAESPDDAVLLVSCSDHAYRTPQICRATALFHEGEVYEDAGEECTPEGPEFGERRNAIIIT